MTDDEQLREWMEANCGGCPDKSRSTTSYALEFLKTMQENLKWHQARTSLAVCTETLKFNLDTAKGIVSRATDILGRLDGIEERTQ